ncbi:Gfo/Idh/MocA family protein [Paenibacillus sp. y28]|uniref:Gfo/Idh/MocA family protein n=1 Tax=Paenibacillus sp. y28 TaxID=3129110 RepID=UPI0030188CA9
MTTNQPLRLGLIGAGNIASVHIKTFTQLPDIRIESITDTYYPLAESRAEEFAIPKKPRTAQELLADPEVDAVIVCAPNQWHAPLAMEAMQAGKHVILEKPMALDVASAKAIVRTQRDTGATLMIPHQMRWEWVALQVKEQMQQGALGRIYNAKAGWLRRKGIPGWGSWFTQKAMSGGGPLIDIGVHMLDLSLYLMGNPKPVSVYGSTYAEFGPKKRGIGSWGTPNWDGFYDVEDIAAALIKMEDGSILSLDVSWAAHLDTDSEPFVNLMGTEGGAAIRGSRGKLLHETADGQLVDRELSPPDGDEGARLRMARHFVSCVRDGQAPLTDAISGLTNNLILDAIYESSRTGREVQLDWSL